MSGFSHQNIWKMAYLNDRQVWILDKTMASYLKTIGGDKTLRDLYIKISILGSQSLQMSALYYTPF